MNAGDDLIKMAAGDRDDDDDDSKKMDSEFVHQEHVSSLGVTMAGDCGFVQRSQALDAEEEKAEGKANGCYRKQPVR